MKRIIIYDSQYGSTMQYAFWLGYSLNTPVVNIKLSSPSDLEGRDQVIIGSRVKFGKVSAAKWIKKHWEVLREKDLILFTVSGIEPSNPELDAIYEQSLPQPIRESLDWFALWGRMDKEKLGFMDKFMINMVAKNTKDPQEREKLENGFDHVSKAQLAPVIKYANRKRTYA